MSSPLSTGLFLCAQNRKKAAGRTPQRSDAEGGTKAATAVKYRKNQEVPLQMANDQRVKVTLVCSECKQRNYDTKKNKKNTSDRLELKKYCRFCRKHTVHRESK